MPVTELPRFHPRRIAALALVRLAHRIYDANYYETVTLPDNGGDVVIMGDHYGKGIVMASGPACDYIDTWITDDEFLANTHRTIEVDPNTFARYHENPRLTVVKATSDDIKYLTPDQPVNVCQDPDYVSMATVVEVNDEHELLYLDVDWNGFHHKEETP